MENFTYEHYVETVSEYLGMDKSEIKNETHIYNELGIDSLGMFSLGMNLIKIYGIKLPLSEVSAIATVGDLYQALEKFKNNQE